MASPDSPILSPERKEHFDELVDQGLWGQISAELADLPASAANWKDVRRLYLRGNGLREVPAAILGMKSLEQIDLGENDLAEIPAALFELPRLHYIQLDGNPRLATLPESAEHMPQLTHLFLHRTALTTNEQARLRAAYPNPVVPHLSF